VRRNCCGLSKVSDPPHLFACPSQQARQASCCVTHPPCLPEHMELLWLDSAQACASAARAKQAELAAAVDAAEQQLQGLAAKAASGAQVGGPCLRVEGRGKGEAQVCGGCACAPEGGA